MGQTHPISVCTGTMHARHVISSRYILLQLEACTLLVYLLSLRIIFLIPSTQRGQIDS